VRGAARCRAAGATTRSSGRSFGSGTSHGRKASSGSSGLPVAVRARAAFHVRDPAGASRLAAVEADPRARLADVAEQAGVSEATVSRVLNATGRGSRPPPGKAALTALDVLG